MTVWALMFPTEILLNYLKFILINLMCVFVTFQPGDSPHMLSIPVTWVKEGGMVRLDKKYLQTDFKGVSTDNIVYSILPSEGQPKYGTLTLSDTFL